MTLQVHLSDSHCAFNSPEEVTENTVSWQKRHPVHWGSIWCISFCSTGRVEDSWCSTMDPLVLFNASSNWLQGFLNNLLQLFMFVPKLLSPQAWPLDASIRWPDLLIHSVMADSLRPRGLVHQAPLFMDFLGKNTRMVCHFLLQGIFQTQGSNLHLLHWQADPLPLNRTAWQLIFIYLYFLQLIFNI